MYTAYKWETQSCNDADKGSGTFIPDGKTLDLKDKMVRRPMSGPEECCEGRYKRSVKHELPNVVFAEAKKHWAIRGENKYMTKQIKKENPQAL